MDQSTNLRLINSAIEHFGRYGLDGVSTRRIASDADTLMSSITYHFGGKQGLYLAAADHIGQRMTEHLAPTLGQVATLLSGGIDAPRARHAVQLIFARMVEVMTDEETAAFSHFIVREQAEPTEAFDRIYQGAMKPMIERVSALLRVISGGGLTDHAARVRTMTLVGQVLVFRVARATVLAGTGWTETGAAEVDDIKAAVAANLDAIFDQLEIGERP